MATPKHYVEILERHFRLRRARNPAYSYRAFARDLKLPASRLSQILKGRQGLSLARATEIAERLGLAELERSVFLDHVEAKHARDPQTRRAARERLLAANVHADWRAIEAADFSRMIDPVYLAARALPSLEGFAYDPKSLAKRLGVSVAKFRRIWATLTELGLLARDSDGAWSNGPHVVRKFEGASGDVRRYHQAVLERAKRAIDQVPIEERDVGAFVFPFASSHLPEARLALAEFRKNFPERFEGGPAPDRVYALSVQFFPLTEKPAVRRAAKPVEPFPTEGPSLESG